MTKSAHRIDTSVCASSAIVRLSDLEMRSQIGVVVSRASSDANYARDLLKKAGIVTANGDLAKKFRG